MTPPAVPRLAYPGRNESSFVPPGRLSPAVSAPEGGAAAPCCLISGDNLLALSALREEIPGQVTLAYLDPPFLTGREHFRVERSRGMTGQIARDERTAFDDRWDSLADYLNALEARIRILKDLLAPHGSIVIHVDPKTSHYLKVMCDEIFGMQSFASEVIWRYRRWPAKTKNFQRVHDVMLRYVKDPATAPRFNQLYEPLAPSTQKTWGDRKQRAITDEGGRRLRSSKTEEKSQGTPLGDVWEIGIVAPVAKERTGYPTQKPEALLQRWIDTCTDEGDLVLDPYMGSGTTLSVACKNARRAIGIDMGAESHAVTRARLEHAGIAYSTRRADVPLARAGARPHPVRAQTAS